MSKAKDRARDLGYRTDPLNRAEYTANDVLDAFIDGYEQAEKDLELGWDDISELNCLLNEVEKEFKKGMHEDKSYKGYCQEVLKRFKKMKEK